MDTNERRILAAVINDARSEVEACDCTDLLIDGEAGAEIACNYVAAHFAKELPWTDPDYPKTEFLLKAGVS